MPTFFLREFERIGQDDSCELRLLGTRQRSAPTAAEGKRWLSLLIAGGKLEGDRLYRFELLDCPVDGREDSSLSVSFYLFPDRRLCPLRIWKRLEQFDDHRRDPEWTVDFEGIPGWSFIGTMEPRWRRLPTVPAERSWMGRSRRDWQKRDCWTIYSSAAAVNDRAA